MSIFNYTTKGFNDEEPEYDPKEDYSPTSWDRDYNEDDETYDERMEDLESYLEGLD